MSLYKNSKSYGRIDIFLIRNVDELVTTNRMKNFYDAINV
jgi:hypothetical protein